MYTSTLVLVILAASLARARPLGVDIKNDNDPTDPHVQTIVDAAVEADRRVRNMRDALNNPNDPINSARIVTAFGPNYQIDKIKNVVDSLGSTTLPIHSGDPSILDAGAKNGKLAKTSLRRDPVTKQVDMSDPMEEVHLGSRFYARGRNQQAGTLIHEGAHFVTQAGDVADLNSNFDIVKATTNPQPVHPLTGYANDVNDHEMSSDTITADQGASLIGTTYDTLRQNSNNMHDNADSYRVFAALCARSFYKRALASDDPVEYYLSKRDKAAQQCNLPKDYFANKAAAAAAQSTANKASSANKGTKLTASKGKGGINGAQSIKGAKIDKVDEKLKAGNVRGVAKATEDTTVVRKPLTKGIKSAKTTKNARSPKLATASKGLKVSNDMKGKDAESRTTRLKATKASAQFTGTVVKGANPRTARAKATTSKVLNKSTMKVDTSSHVTKGKGVNPRTAGTKGSKTLNKPNGKVVKGANPIRKKAAKLGMARSKSSLFLNKSSNTVAKGAPKSKGAKPRTAGAKASTSKVGEASGGKKAKGTNTLHTKMGNTGAAGNKVQKPSNQPGRQTTAVPAKPAAGKSMRKVTKSPTAVKIPSVATSVATKGLTRAAPTVKKGGKKLRRDLESIFDQMN